jgi:MFS family permease
MFAYRSILREPPRPAVIRENPRAPWLAVSVVCFGAFMGQLDASIVAITFPAMQREFSAPVGAVQWVSLSYLLGLIVMLAPAGRLGDAVGRQLVYAYGFAAFTVASAACGHLGSHSYQAGNPDDSGSEQARPAFAVLAVVAAAAAAIALASHSASREPAEQPREGSPSGEDH